VPYMYQITKYDPAERDERGAYAGSLDSASDHGLIEAAYLDTVAAFAAANGLTWL
jgi:small subunit ribosomal protein S1